MQTFLPDPDFERTARILDDRRLGKQRVEVLQILNAMHRTSGGWVNHPATRMWRGFEPALVAYLVLSPEAASEGAPTSAPNLDVDGLRTALKLSVPDYMVPQHFVEMSAFPLTPNGKIDKKKLPAPLASNVEATAVVTPSTSTERVLERIWASVLGLPEVSVIADFFHLGGHSLLVAQVIARASREIGVELSMLSPGAGSAPASAGDNPGEVSSPLDVPAFLRRQN